MRLSNLSVPILFGALQCAVTTGFATAVTTLRQDEISMSAICSWASSWAMSWAMVLPVVVAAAPHLQKLATRLAGGTRGRPQA